MSDIKVTAKEIVEMGTANAMAFHFVKTRDAAQLELLLLESKKINYKENSEPLLKRVVSTGDESLLKVLHRVSPFFQQEPNALKILIEGGNKEWAEKVFLKTQPSMIFKLLNDDGSLWIKNNHELFERAFLSLPKKNQEKLEMANSKRWLRSAIEGGVDHLVEHFIKFNKISLSDGLDSWVFRGENRSDLKSLLGICLEEKRVDYAQQLLDAGYAVNSLVEHSSLHDLTEIALGIEQGLSGESIEWLLQKGVSPFSKFDEDGLLAIPSVAEVQMWYKHAEDDYNCGENTNPNREIIWDRPLREALLAERYDIAVLLINYGSSLERVRTDWNRSARDEFPKGFAEIESEILKLGFSAKEKPKAKIL